MPNGERVQIAIPPVTKAGCISFTIRKPSKEIFTLNNYQQQGYFKQCQFNEENQVDELSKLKQQGDMVGFLEQAIAQRKKNKSTKKTLFAMPAYTNSNEHSFFNDTCPRLHKIIQHLESHEAKQAEHGNIEAFINIQGTEVLRRLFQGFLNLKTADEKTQRISGNNGTVLNHVRKNCKRNLESLFGQVVVQRKHLLNPVFSV